MSYPAVRYQTSFRSGPALLHGDLVLPSGPGPHPAVVLVGGSSGPRDRGHWVDDLAAHGFATLSWDSPGWGGSSGERRWQAPHERALEIVAAVDQLAGIGDVAPGGVAVVGTDAGGWGAVLAASLTRRIGAVALLAPPCTGVQEQEVLRLGQRLRGRGFITAEVALAEMVLRERIRRLAAGHDAPSVLRAEAPCRHAPWYGWLPGTTPGELAAFAALASYRPAGLLSSVGCPVLGVFGADDPATPLREGTTVLFDALGRAPGGEHRIFVLGRTDEAFVPAGAPGRPVPLVPGDWHPDVVHCLTQWLVPHLTRSALAA